MVGAVSAKESALSLRAAINVGGCEMNLLNATETKETTGEFLGIDEGDYFHWRMKDSKGVEVSFFILNPGASVETVLEKPESFVGKRCRVTWKKSMETIPEAGGKIEVKQILEVKWVSE